MALERYIFLSPETDESRPALMVPALGHTMLLPHVQQERPASGTGDGAAPDAGARHAKETANSQQPMRETPEPTLQPGWRRRSI